jgi:hypothetical protein
LGCIVVPQQDDALDETQDADKKLLLARKMNSTAMCLLSLSLTDMVIQMALYTGRTTGLPSGNAAKDLKNSLQDLYQEE